MTYQPGKHIICTMQVEDRELLMRFTECQKLIYQLIERYQLHKIGDVMHDFPAGGFTLVVCLSESHLSIHTWPEHGLLNMDIYLSNFERNNDGTVMGIYEALQSHFQGQILHEQIITR